jgi:hypothetical protein
MSQIDDRRVALIKSLATGNRFYSLVEPESGIRNADMVEDIPFDILLGIAYPCLEDGLNDFAVIRTTYETLEYFPDDEEMRRELMEIVQDARGKLIKRLMELRDRISSRQAHFLGTDLEDFKSYALDIVNRGYPRRNLDSMMKLNVFSSVAEIETGGGDSEPLYYYRFRDTVGFHDLLDRPARFFVSALFDDVLQSVLDDENYKSRYTFDRHVFQKFIALMFVNYATTDPIFYGTNRADYGVSEDKDMDSTPLYMAVAKALRQIEMMLRAEDSMAPGADTVADSPDIVKYDHTLEPEGEVVLPGALINEDVLLAPIASICAAIHQLRKKQDPEAQKLAKIVLSEASKLVEELKRLNIISPFAYNPGANDLSLE